MSNSVPVAVETSPGATDVSTAIEVLKLFPKGSRPSEAEQALYNRALEVLTKHLGPLESPTPYPTRPETNPPLPQPKPYAPGPMPPAPAAQTATTAPTGAIPPPGPTQK